MVNSTPIMNNFNDHVMRTYGRLPVVLAEGRGAYVWDADGKKYLDFLTGLAVCSIGHCNPKVADAISRQASKLIHCSNLYYTEEQGKLAEMLTSLSGMGKAFFCNSGAEANEGAVKLARKYAKMLHGPSKYGIITAKNSFHGRTLAMITATGQTKYQEGFEPLPPGFSYADFNDLGALERAIDDTTCAVMLEPVQGESGVYPAEEDYIQGVRKLCDDKGLLLILDEVQAGMGRTGRLFAHDHFGVKPDILTLAKAIAGGVPMGCMMATDKVSAAFGPGNHASTFGGNPLACAAALATLEVLIDDGAIENGAKQGKKILEAVRSWKTSSDAVSPFIGDTRGLGMMIGIDLKGVDGGKILNIAMERGLLINSIAGRKIRLLPPLTLSDSEVAEGLDILYAAILSAKE